MISNNCTQQELSSLIVTADRCCSRDYFIEYLTRLQGLSAILVMPEHLIRIRPFFPVSLLKIGLENDMPEYFNLCMMDTPGATDSADDGEATRNDKSTDSDAMDNTGTDPGLEFIFPDG